MGKSKYSLLPRKDELKPCRLFRTKFKFFFSSLHFHLVLYFFWRQWKFFFLLQVVIKLVMKIEFQKVVFIEQREVYERRKKLNRNQILSSKSETQKTPSWLQNFFFLVKVICRCLFLNKPDVTFLFSSVLFFAFLKDSKKLNLLMDYEKRITG